MCQIIIIYYPYASFYPAVNLQASRTGNNKCNSSSDVKRLCEQQGLQTLFEGGNGRCGDDVGIGRLFHTRGAAAPNARSLIVRSRVQRTTNFNVNCRRS